MLTFSGQANWPENGLQMAEVFFTSKSPHEMGLTTCNEWVPLVRNDCDRDLLLRNFRVYALLECMIIRSLLILMMIDLSP